MLLIYSLYFINHLRVQPTVSLVITRILYLEQIIIMLYINSVINLRIIANETKG